MSPRRPPARGGEPDADAPGARAAYDYVLAVGPSRSGSTFLYRALNAHPAFCAPEIKEAHYYRSPRRLARALGELRGSGAMLLDVADTAWPDPQLAKVAELARGGVRTLVVVLLRRHRDQVRSTMAYRKSRVLPALAGWMSGPAGLERAAVRDSLTPAALERIFALGADVLTVEFEVLADRPRPVLDALARLCRAEPFGRIATAPVNPAQRARFAPLAAAAKLAAVALRAAGARRTLQALKDRPRIVALVFRPAAEAERPALSEAAGARLDRREQACRAAVGAASEPLAEGLWLARSGSEPRRRRPDGGAD